MCINSMLPAAIANTSVLQKHPTLLISFWPFNPDLISNPFENIKVIFSSDSSSFGYIMMIYHSLLIKKYHGQNVTCTFNCSRFEWGRFWRRMDKAHKWLCVLYPFSTLQLFWIYLIGRKTYTIYTECFKVTEQKAYYKLIK